MFAVIGLLGCLHSQSIHDLDDGHIDLVIDDGDRRGQLAASFFQSEDTVTGRFGDVLISFALE